MQALRVRRRGEGRCGSGRAGAWGEPRPWCARFAGEAQPATPRVHAFRPASSGRPAPGPACRHSYRWLRFPCCGARYPCDLWCAPPAGRGRIGAGQEQWRRPVRSGSCCSGLDAGCAGLDPCRTRAMRSPPSPRLPHDLPLGPSLPRSHEELADVCDVHRLPCAICKAPAPCLNNPRSLEELTDGHEMRWATRMVCGYCSVEQAVAPECKHCSKKLAASAGAGRERERDGERRAWRAGLARRLLVPAAARLPTHGPPARLHPPCPPPSVCVQPRPAGGARGSGRVARASATLRSFTRTTPGAPGHHAVMGSSRAGHRLHAWAPPLSLPALIPAAPPHPCLQALPQQGQDRVSQEQAGGRRGQGAARASRGRSRLDKPGGALRAARRGAGQRAPPAAWGSPVAH